MGNEKYVELVREALDSGPGTLRKSIEFSESQGVFDSLGGKHQHFDRLAGTLQVAVDHITIPNDVIAKAMENYNEVAVHVRNRLDWPEEAIDVIPQGSSATKTLIRSADGSNFDIDAVLAVDYSFLDLTDPVAFFTAVGEALEKYDPEQKKRCWKLPFAGERHYLEFTPSVPLDRVLEVNQGTMHLRYASRPEYRSTALAVVNMPTKEWKTSNPKGIVYWVNTTSELQLISPILDSVSFSKSSAGVEPVPEQTVPLTDTLRIAIRLVKRHRDINAFLGSIDKDFQPISIIIVTLLTRAYEALAALGTQFNHPLEALIALADLLPQLIIQDERGNYLVENPTVEGENFAERWNEQGSKHAETFYGWCALLVDDLKFILAAPSTTVAEKRIYDKLGISPSAGNAQGNIDQLGFSVDASKLPRRKPHAERRPA